MTVYAVLSLAINVPENLSLPSNFNVVAHFAKSNLCFPSVDSSLVSSECFSVPVSSVSSVPVPSAPLRPLLTFAHFRTSGDASSQCALSWDT